MREYGELSRLAFYEPGAESRPQAEHVEVVVRHERGGDRDLLDSRAPGRNRLRGPRRHRGELVLEAGVRLHLLHRERPLDPFAQPELAPSNPHQRVGRLDPARWSAGERINEG